MTTAHHLLPSSASLEIGLSPVWALSAPVISEAIGAEVELSIESIVKASACVCYGTIRSRQNASRFADIRPFKSPLKSR
jgi:hypothetical protein